MHTITFLSSTIGSLITSILFSSVSISFLSSISSFCSFSSIVLTIDSSLVSIILEVFSSSIIFSVFFTFSSSFIFSSSHPQIKKAKSIAILTHESPDGDAVGSSLAMYYALKQLGINADVVIKEFPKMFLNLDGVKYFIPSSEKVYDLVITLDCANQKRLSEQEIFNNAKFVSDADLTI